MKTFVVFYSMSGNCEWVAKRIAAHTDAKLLQIIPEKAYPDKGMRKFIWGGKSAVMGDTPKVKPYDFHAENGDQVIIGFPVWASNMAPPIRTFVKDNLSKLQNCKVSAFACQGGSGAEKAFEKLKKLLQAEKLEAELILIEPKTTGNAETEQTIERFCGEITCVSP